MIHVGLRGQTRVRMTAWTILFFTIGAAAGLFLAAGVLVHTRVAWLLLATGFAVLISVLWIPIQRRRSQREQPMRDRSISETSRNGDGQ